MYQMNVSIEERLCLPALPWSILSRPNKGIFQPSLLLSKTNVDPESSKAKSIDSNLAYKELNTFLKDTTYNYRPTTCWPNKLSAHVQNACFL